MKKTKGGKFTFFKKHKKVAVLLICLVLFVSSFAFINYSRYVKDIVRTYYLRTKKFYFNSNRLTLDGKVYQSNPWVVNDDEYEISISMNTKLNSIRVMEDDVTYTASCEVMKDGKISDVAECYIGDNKKSEMTRTISGSNSTDAVEPNMDNFNVLVNPVKRDEIKDGDIVSIVITAVSSSPYVQTLSASFELVAGNYGVSYEIDDQTGRRYIDCLVNNTLPDEKKIVELEIKDTDKIIFDQNNAILDTINKYSKEDIEKYGFGTYVNDEGYITRVRFRVDEKASSMVRFYKTNLSDNYSILTNNIDSGVSSGVVSMTILEEEDFIKKEEPTPDPEPTPSPEPENPDSGDNEENNENVDDTENNAGEEGLE